MDEAVNDKKPLSVSDWSQPYKLAVYAVAIVGFASFLWFAVVPWAKNVTKLLTQISVNTQNTAAILYALTQPVPNQPK